MLGNTKNHHKAFKTNYDDEVNYMLLCCTVDEWHLLRLSLVLVCCPLTVFLNAYLFLTGFKVKNMVLSLKVSSF